MIPYHNEIKLEISNRNIAGYSDIWKLNNILLNNTWVEEVSGEIQKYLNKIKIKIKTETYVNF